MYEARYVTGIVAGKQTKTNTIGFVAAFPIPEVIRAINAFTLGVQSVNPDAKVKVLWTNTWYNPSTEKQAALTLIDAGADVIAQHQNTPGPQQAAEERGVYGIGYNVDMSANAPKASLATTWICLPTHRRLPLLPPSGTGALTTKKPLKKYRQAPGNLPLTGAA